jgi:predicted NACHT family NTPase
VPNAVASQAIILNLVEAAMSRLAVRVKGAERSSNEKSVHAADTRVANALHQAVSLTASWARFGGTADSNPRPLAEQFIEPDVVSRRRNEAAVPLGTLLRRPLFSAMADEHSHLVLIGSAGSGKTTALKMMAVRALATGSHLPIVLRLCEVKSQREDAWPIQGALCRMLALDTASLSTNANEPSDPEHKQRVEFLSCLDELGLMVLLDGLDEIANPQDRTAALAEFSRMAGTLTRTRIVLSSRPGDVFLREASATILEIAPLSREQIHTYATLRLRSADDAKHLLAQVEASPYGHAVATPLLLETLCAIYMRIGSIPSKPRSSYRKFVNLFLEEWDQQRNVRRTSHYARFEVDRKYDFLAHLAFALSVKDLVTFSANELLSSINDIAHLHGLPSRDAELIVREIESYTGLLVQKSQGQYSFAHRSIQEYLCADYLIRNPSLRFLKSHLHGLPNELAIAAALSANSAEYVVELTFDYIVHSSQRSQFASAFVGRLVLERPDFVPSQDLELALFCLAVLADSLDVFEQLNLPTTELDAFRVASKYYHLEPNTSPPQLLAHTRHPSLALPFSLDLSKGVAVRLAAAGPATARR